MLLRIGEVRSLIPTSAHVMALTATATRSDISFISRIVGLRNPFVITRVPVIPNLIYAVGLFKSIPETFQNLAQKLVIERNKFPKTIIYGRSFGVCGDMYLFFKDYLGAAFTILMMHLIFLNFASWTCLQVSLIQPINLKSFVYLRVMAIFALL